MGLYLCIFDGEVDIDGVEVGAYEDFNTLRTYVTEELEGGRAGSRFPTLILHSDCDGAWSPEEAGRLEEELTTIREALSHRPPTPLAADWQREVARRGGLALRTQHDRFFDVDGEPLLDRLIALARLSQGRALPILFQ